MPLSTKTVDESRETALEPVWVVTVAVMEKQWDGGERQWQGRDRKRRVLSKMRLVERKRFPHGKARQKGKVYDIFQSHSSDKTSLTKQHTALWGKPPFRRNLHEETQNGLRWAIGVGIRYEGSRNQHQLGRRTLIVSHVCVSARSRWVDTRRLQRYVILASSVTTWRRRWVTGDLIWWARRYCDKKWVCSNTTYKQKISNWSCFLRFFEGRNKLLPTIRSTKWGCTVGQTYDGTYFFLHKYNIASSKASIRYRVVNKRLTRIP